jgi:uncharacterized protein YjbI with pentapeptide repeats
MANPEHLAKLKEGVELWNQWRKVNPDVRIDLSGANFTGAILVEANLQSAELSGVTFEEADLSGANLILADLRFSGFQKARLHGTYLRAANLTAADFSGADLNGADLSGACLIMARMNQANLTGCWVYGISAWDLHLEGTIQSNLIVTKSAPSIQVDNLEVAQFIHLLLNNEGIRNVIDTITSKVVLILGRFTPERKAVLDAIRDELRKRDYLPILFDFRKPDSKSLTGTVQTLANMARFIIADLTDPSCIPYELATVVPHTKVPVQAIILDGNHEFAMFNDLLD